MSLSLPPTISLGVARLDQKHIEFKGTLLLYHKLLHLKRYAQKKKAWVSVWLEISNSAASPDILFYVSNQQRNVNVSLAPARAIGAESVCVCLTPKCLKCLLSASLSFWLCCWCICRRHNNQLTEPICWRPLPLSPNPLDNTFIAQQLACTCLTSYNEDEHIWSEYSALNAFHFVCFFFFIIWAKAFLLLQDPWIVHHCSLSMLQQETHGALEVYVWLWGKFLAIPSSTHVPLTFNLSLHYRNETSWKQQQCPWRCLWTF